MAQDKPDLDRAYALQTPEDSKRLYAKWADSYDTSFAAEMDYRLPDHVERVFVGTGGTGPVLDLGAGTGLCAQALAQRGVAPIDGTDISQDMLDIAAQKNIYRSLFTGDLTGLLPVEDGGYTGLVSSGTFTTGHVGPEALDEVLRIAAPGAVIALSINAKYWAERGFEEKFAALGASITDLQLPEVRIYGPANTSEHRDATGLVAVFRKA
ncbi:methyltransferase domain-containing protein [Primorskyibacter aestuariivivens]|uniref:class I SAM-dependent DNA methyltransferase n=1 Tax=Primorskyibacter aestuariivivens TaxID=1888912 RepID=UPI002300D8C3|nr:methyltransferase domain-containing protein [Primorskyibacter aestuariivivens]MDA7427746.1 methyltransferase domain-containing protein [Primorskyibacter aestuariivivens]